MPSRSRGTDEWRPIPGYDGYEITRTGRVRSITRRVPMHGTKSGVTRHGKELKPFTRNKIARDRLQVRIHNDFDIVIEYVDDLVRLTYDQP
jgi:hypothetical protein